MECTYKFLNYKPVTCYSHHDVRKSRINKGIVHVGTRRVYGESLYRTCGEGAKSRRRTMGNRLIETSLI